MIIDSDNILTSNILFRCLNVGVGVTTITLPTGAAAPVANGLVIPVDATSSSQTLVFGTAGPVTRFNSVFAGARTYTLSTTGVYGGEVWTFIRTAAATGAFDATLGSAAALAVAERVQLYYTGSAWELYSGVEALAAT